MIDAEAREINDLIEYYKDKLWKSTGIPSTYLKSSNRKNKINKILNGIGCKSI